MAEYAGKHAHWTAVTRVVTEMVVRTAQCARDLARGVAGTHSYDQYVAHCRAHHPDGPVLSREEFFRREFTEKWEGIRRCC